MMTSWQVSPGTSTPCHSDMVPNSDVPGSATKVRVSSDSCASPWQSSVSPGSSRRQYSAACSAARRDENRPSVRPSAAHIS